MPSLFAVLMLLACAAAPALADSLQGHVLAGRSVQAAAAAAGAGKAGGATPPAADATPPAAGATPSAAGATPSAAGATPPAAGATSPAAGATTPAAGATPPAAGEPARPEIALGTEFGIGGVKVTVVDARDPKAVFATSTAADGRFSVEGIAAGSYRVTFAHGALGQRTVQAMVGKGVGELVFVWETAPGRPPGDLPLPAARQ